MFLTKLNKHAISNYTLHCNSSVDELGPNLGLYYAEGCRCSHFGWIFKAGMSISGTKPVPRLWR